MLLYRFSKKIKIKMLLYILTLWYRHHTKAHLWKLSLSFMLSLLGFTFSIWLVVDIIYESLSLSLWFLEVAYKILDDFFCIFRLWLLLFRLFTKIALCLFGGESKHLRGSLKAYCGTNLDGKLRLSCITFVLLC